MSATSAERLKTPLLFPCAARVKMPQIGSEDSDLKPSQKNTRYAPDSIVFRSTEEPSAPINKNYLKLVSNDLRFEEDVVKERCYHALPYDEKYLYEALDIAGIVTLPPKSKMPTGRHNTRGEDHRHMPCNLTKSTHSHLKPMKRKIMERAKEMHAEALKREQLRAIQQRIIETHNAQKLKEQESGRTDDGEEESEKEKSGIFITETQQDDNESEETREAEEAEEKDKVPKLRLKKPPKVETAKMIRKASALKTQTKTAAELLAEDEEKKEQKERVGNDWDSYLMSLLSNNTATWIVYERTPAGSQDR